MAGITGYGLSPFSATTTNQITSATLVRGSGLLTTGSAASDAWGSSGFDSIDLSTSIANGDYFTITIAIPATNSFSLTKVSSHNFRRSGTGSTNIQWQYSTDGITFTNIGSPIPLPDSSPAGNVIPEITLSSISVLQNITNTVITFRVVGYGGTASTGTGYINNVFGKDLEIIGSYN